jgi:PLP dependent protein
MIAKILNELAPYEATLVAVSKTKPLTALQAVYALGQRDFGENYVQELTEKQPQMPDDVRWHFIGHLQSNKVKYIAPFVYLIHAVDSENLLKEINKQAAKNNRKINVLLQLKINDEATKFGFDEDEILDFLTNKKHLALENVNIVGMMGMATFTDDLVQVRGEFKKLKTFFDHVKQVFFPEKEDFKTISMGMSDDYLVALEEGATMIRIGSLIFGSRK